MRSATLGRDTAGDAEMSACIVAATRGWRFPASDDGGLTLVTSTYVFESSILYH